MNVQIIIFEGFDELDVVGPFEVLRNAEKLGCDLTVNLATLGEPAEIEAGRGRVIALSKPRLAAELMGS